jgi:glycosyltransferase 2 family protein
VTAALCVIAFIGLGVSLPSSPGFIGVIQAATVLALSFFGIGKADALGFSLLMHASQFVPVTLWGLLLLVVEHVSLTEATRTGAATGLKAREKAT